MDIKKALKMTAFGFMFTLINLNLTLNGHTLNVMPDFIGWILLFIAFDKFGEYKDSMPWLKWMSAAIGAASFVQWVMGIANPEMDIRYLITCAEIAAAVYNFLFFGILIHVAEDMNSGVTERLSFLRYFNAVIYAALAVLSLVAAPENVAFIAMGVLILGLAALIAAIVTMFTLFKLSKEAETVL
ncbi:MAG: hypothetical protein IKG46_12130 [Solobacterium sp.]|nr:hypothetical protein [Solobacterium sp.]